MLDIFLEEKIVTVCILAFFTVSIMMQILLSILYQNMIKETENMATTDHKLLKQCKLKFANCYQLNNGVPNIPIFVDKFLSRLALGPLSFESMYHLSGQTVLLSVVSAGVGIFRCIMRGKALGEILPFYIVSFLELYLYFSISTMLDVKGKRRNLKVNLVDYLENHLSARISVTADDMEMLYGKGAYGPARSRRGVRTARGGRRTVEFMPISNRMSLPEGTEGIVGETASDRERLQISQSKQDAGQLPMDYTGTDQELERRERERELEELLQEFLTI